MQQEGVDIWVSALLYIVVIQAVLMFGSELWVMPDTIMMVVEGAHVGLLCHIVGKWVRRQSDGSWETPASE